MELIFNKEIIDKIPNNIFDSGGEPATILKDKNDRRWFLTVDVARGLGYSQFKGAIKQNVDPKEMIRYGKLKKIIPYDPPKVRDDWRFLSEKGLHDFIIAASKKKEKAQLIMEAYFY